MFQKNYSIFKPTPKNTGGVLNLDLSPTGMWLSMAPQNGERNFDYSKKLTMSVSIDDAGRILDLLDSKYQTVDGKNPKEASIFHQTDAGTKILGITWSDQFKCFYATLTASNASGTAKIGLPINKAEVYVIKALLNYGIIKMAEWDKVVVAYKERTATKETIPTINIDTLGTDTGETIDLNQAPF